MYLSLGTSVKDHRSQLVCSFTNSSQHSWRQEHLKLRRRSRTHIKMTFQEGFFPPTNHQSMRSRLASITFSSLAFLPKVYAGAAFASFNSRVGNAGTIWANDKTLRSLLVTTSVSRWNSDSQTAGNSRLPAVMDSQNTETSKDVSGDIRIAVIGGGIAGITAASSIATRLKDNKNVKIVVFEADSSAANDVTQRRNQPKWTAATARNANSIVPGASMHIMSQRSTLKDILSDTVEEAFMLAFERVKRSFRSTFKSHSEFVPVWNIDNFDIPPPYFSFHPMRCLGHHCTSEERWTFVTFLKTFLSTCLLSGPKEADERAVHIMKLAKANRVALLQEFETMAKDSRFDENDFGIRKGFLSLHRNLDKANSVLRECEQFGETAELLSWDKAVELEPHIRNLPVSPIHAVLRPEDFVASCLVFVQNLKERCKSTLGIEFLEDEDGIVHAIKHINKNPEKSTLSSTRVSRASTEASASHRRFQVTTSNGGTYESDYLVLAAGVNTPLFARQLDVGHLCPTYPLRGYSLTLYRSDDEKENSEKQGQLLQRPLSFDSLYCTSINPDMARLAGFGELVGYKECAKDVPSVAPRIIARYGRALFPEVSDIKATMAVQCFRPLSPDDIPIAGKVSAVSGLFFHTGHGTLGWTMSLATADCVAQAICDDINETEGMETYELPDKTEILRNVLSPDRFA